MGHATDVGTRLYATMYPDVVKATHFTHWRKDPSMGEFDVPGALSHIAPPAVNAFRITTTPVQNTAQIQRCMVTGVCSCDLVLIPT